MSKIVGLSLHKMQMEVYKSKARFRVVVAGRRWGKALALNTPIPTPTGWKSMGELQDNDIVFDESGKPCKVVCAHDVLYGRPCYEVEFSNGEKIVADEEHLWEIWSNTIENTDEFSSVILTTKDVSQALSKGISCAARRSGPVQYDPKSNFSTSPYSYGFILGKSKNQAISSDYLHSSVEDRLELLQGLIDSCGSFCAPDNCQISSKSKNFTEDVLQVIFSLGLKASMTCGRALAGDDREEEFTITFSKRIQQFDYRFIVAVRSVESVPVRCITVNSKSSLYLCGRSFTPTHNTALSRVTLIRKAAMSPRQRVWYVAPTYRMAKQIMWNDLLETIPKAWIKKINETSLTITLINKSVIELKGADKPDSLRGVGINFLVLDEFQDMTEETWTKALRPTLADTGGHALFIGTPKAYNYLYELYKNGQDEKKVKAKSWQSWQFPTITSPFIPVAEIEAARQDMDEKSFKQEFEACHLPETKIILWGGKEKEIKDITKDDYVVHLGDDGQLYRCPVIQVGETGIKQVVEVTMETGEIILASNHHKFKVSA